MRTRPGQSESLDASNITSVLLHRRDDIVADWLARQDRPSGGAPDEETVALARELVSAILRAAVADPASPDAAADRRALARVAASHGVRLRASGGAVSCVPYENSVLFESLWSAITQAGLDESDRDVVARRVQDALGLCLMAALLGYELGHDPAQHAVLEGALEQCCVTRR